MKKKVRHSSPQGNFFGMVDKSESREDTVLKPAELEITEEFLIFPKIVVGSFTCPDCGSKVRLRPDGLADCPKCVMKVPFRAAHLKRENSEVLLSL